MFHEDHLPAVLNFYDEPVVATPDIEYRQTINKVRMRIRGFYFCDIAPGCVSGDLMPLRNWPFEGVISCNCLPPRAFANDMHSISGFAICEASLNIFAKCEEVKTAGQGGRRCRSAEEGEVAGNGIKSASDIMVTLPI